jgi:hypothetical protein
MNRRDFLKGSICAATGLWLPDTKANLFSSGKFESVGGAAAKIYSPWGISDTLDPANKYSGLTLSNGNLTVVSTSGAEGPCRSVASHSAGKWVFEMMLNQANAANTPQVGLCNASLSMSISAYIGSTVNGWGYFASSGNKYHSNSNVSYGASYTLNNVIGVLVDLDNGTLIFYKNGATQGTAYNTGLTGTALYACYCGYGTTTSQCTFNFGGSSFAYSYP